MCQYLCCSFIKYILVHNTPRKKLIIMKKEFKYSPKLKHYEDYGLQKQSVEALTHVHRSRFVFSSTNTRTNTFLDP